MSNVGPISVLAAFISEEISARRRGVEIRNRDGPRYATPSHRAAQIDGDQLSLQQRLVRRIGAIETSDPERDSKGLKVFLEVVFLEEFGADVCEDPVFRDLLARVHSSMLRDTSISRPILTAMSRLFDVESGARK